MASSDSPDIRDSRYLVAGELVLDRDDQRAWRGGDALPLGAKAIALLEELMRHPGLLVTKERLFETAWPGRAVSDAVLTTAIRELRRALDDPARSPHWIETHHGKGYRFLPDVAAQAVRPGSDAAHPGKEGSDGSRAWWYIRLAILPVALAIGMAAAIWTWWPRDADDMAAATARDVAARRVAILPFRVEIGDAWIGGAMAARLTDVLENAPGILVVEPQDAQAIARSGLSSQTARDMAIASYVSGAVRSGAAGLRVAVAVRGPSGATIWSRRFTGREDDLIDLTERVAMETAKALRVAANPEKVAAMAEIGTTSIVAFEAYSRAEQVLDSIEGFQSAARFEGAIENLETAVAADPKFGRAAGELAWFVLPSAYSPDAEGADARAFALMARAIAHAPNDLQQRLATAHRDMRALRLDAARRTLLSAYEETRRTASTSNHSILIMLSHIAAATGDRALAERSWRDLTEYSLARGRIQMRNPAIVGHSRPLLDRFASHQAQQEPTPLGSYVRHIALLLAGRTEDAARLLETDATIDGTGFATMMRVGQACAEDRVADARALARRTLSAADAPSLTNWRIAQIAGLRDAIERNRPPADSPARQRAVLVMMGEPGFDPSPYPLLVEALARSGRGPHPVARSDYFCPLER